MQKGKIIFLNGVSSSGKTILANFLQGRLDELFLMLSVDTFCYMAHNKFWKSDSLSTGLNVSKGFHHTIKTFSDLGINVIVDQVLRKDYKTLDECLKLLHNHPILFVRVVCPIEELRRREKERGDRNIGESEKQLSLLDPQDTYDLIVDTYNNSKEECADKIIELLGYPEKFTAFKNLWSQRTK